MIIQNARATLIKDRLIDESELDESSNASQFEAQLRVTETRAHQLIFRISVAVVGMAFYLHQQHVRLKELETELISRIETERREKIKSIVKRSKTM